MTGTPVVDVLLAHGDAPDFVLRGDPLLLKLGADDAPDALNWPDLSGLTVRAITDGMLPARATRLIAVLLRAGADSVQEFDVANTEPHLVRTHTGDRS